MITLSRHFNVLTTLLTCLLLSACQPSKNSSPHNFEGQDQSQPHHSSPQLELPIPEAKAPRFPEQPVLTSYPSDMLVVMDIYSDESENTQQLKLSFKKKRSLFGSSIYILEEAFQKVEKRGFFSGDTLKYYIKSPWNVIWADMKTFLVYGGSEVGSGEPIGFIHTSTLPYKLESVSEVTIRPEHKSIEISEPLEMIHVEIKTCPTLVAKMGAAPCKVYVAVYNTLTAVDFATFGKIAPDIAKKVISVNEIIGLIKGYWTFKADIDAIRDDYLIPLLKAIKGVEKLKELSLQEETLYLERSASAYAELISTSMKTIVKTQKMMPQAFENMNHLALGSALAYLGQESLGDKVISHKQPPWFEEIVAPVVREMGVLTFDLILNGTNTL